MAVVCRLLIHTFIYMCLTLDIVFTTDIPSADLADLNSAKLIRLEITKHIKYLQEFIKNMDDWALEKISVLTKNDRFNKSSTEYIDKKNKIFSQNITDLSNELYSVNDLDELSEIKHRSLIIGTKLDNYFDNSTMDGLNMLVDYKGDTGVCVLYRYLSAQMDGLALTIENLEKQIVKNMEDNCIREIKNENYYRAAIILNKLVDIDKSIDTIVSETNNVQILNLSKEITNITQSFLLHKSLIKHNFSTKSGDLIMFIESLNNEIINQKNTPKEIRDEAFKVKDKAIDLLINEIVSKYDTIEFCENNFPDKLLKLDLLSLKFIFHKIISIFSENLDYIEHNIFYCLSESSGNNFEYSMKLANLAKYLTEIGLNVKEITNNNLPSLITNLIIPDQIYLKNTLYETYLIDYDTLSFHGGNQRCWELIATNVPDEFYIKNKYLNKYLALPLPRAGFKTNKTVYLTEEKLTVWKFQVENDNYLIQDKRSGGYLYFASDFSGLLRVGNETLQQYWEVNDCSRI